MSSALSTGGTSSPAAVVSAFVDRHKVVLLGGCGRDAGGADRVVGLDRARTQRPTRVRALRAERLQDLYQTWRAEPEGTRKTNLGEDLIQDVDRILRQFPRRYAAQRALYVRAQYRFDLEQWSDAVADWQEVATRWPDSYLAPLSVFNAAIASEEAGQPEQALEQLQRIVDQWGGHDPCSARLVYNRAHGRTAWRCGYGTHDLRPPDGGTWRQQVGRGGAQPPHRTGDPGPIGGRVGTPWGAPIRHPACSWSRPWSAWSSVVACPIHVRCCRRRPLLPSPTRRIRSVFPSPRRRQRPGARLETFGYEVYYRFSAIGGATDRNLPDLAQLDSSGFVSLRKADDRHPLAATGRPLIEVPGAARAEHRVTLSFVALEAGADPGRHVEFRWPHLAASRRGGYLHRPV